jgi:nitrogen fixation protein FixH
VAVTDEGYVVAVKPSARRASAAAGEWVNSAGSTREFPGRKAADSWARSCSTDDALVYVRDANPRDGDADGYLMALRRPDGRAGDADVTVEQAGFARYRRDREDQAGLEQFDLL